jgi:hypothetical protein
MRSAARDVVAFFTVLATLSLAPELAFAVTRPGFGGVPATSSEASAFHYSASVIAGVYGLGLHNRSDAAKFWLYDLTLEPGQAYTIVVRVAEDGTENGLVYCYPIVVGPNGQAIIGGGTSATSSNVTGYQDLTLTTEVVPEGGLVYTVCQISARNSAKILSIEWF